MYYKIAGDEEHYAGFLPENFTMEMARKFDGRSLADKWGQLHFDLTDPFDDRPIPEMITGYIPACSFRVYEAIKDICEGIVEFLPCTLGKEKLDYFVWNIIGTKDVVDYERTVCHRFPSTGRIMFFNTIVFKEEISAPLFKIKDLPYTYFFCTEQFKGILESIDVRGVMFSNDLFTPIK